MPTTTTTTLTAPFTAAAIQTDIGLAARDWLRDALSAVCEAFEAQRPGERTSIATRIDDDGAWGGRHLSGIARLGECDAEPEDTVAVLAFIEEGSETAVFELGDCDYNADHLTGRFPVRIGADVRRTGFARGLARLAAKDAARRAAKAG